MTHHKESWTYLLIVILLQWNKYVPAFFCVFNKKDKVEKQWQRLLVRRRILR